MALPKDVRALFPFKPDWKSPVEETYEFKTNVLRSRDMTGQWRGLRSKPRERVQYQVQLAGDEAANFQYRMHHSQPYTWLLPQWPRVRILSASADLGTNTLVLAKPVSYLAAVGDEYVLIPDDPLLEPEVITVDAISGDRLTLTTLNPLTANWSSGARIYPAWRCLVGGESSAEWVTSKVLQANMAFRRLVTDLEPVSPSLSADATVGGMEVLTRRLNWASGQNATFQWLPEYVDSEVGPFSGIVRGLQAGQIRQGEVVCKSRDEVDWWLAFFNRRKGQRVPFKMPTWLGDLPLHDPINSVDFEVSTSDLGRFAPELTMYSHLMVLKKDGSFAFFEISSFTPDFTNGVTIVSTVESWGESYGPWEAPMAGLVTNSHLASDSLTVTWLTDEVARISLSVKSEDIPE